MKPLATLLMVVVTVSCVSSAAHADRKSRLEEKARQERVQQQKQQVEYLLKQENAGRLTDRKQALKEMIAAGDAPDEAYWQAGYIRKGDQWVSVGDRWLTAEQEKQLEEYTKARSNSVDSDEGHYQLAQWCAENGFDAQAYAHLKAVLLNNPDHAGLRQLLGYQKIGDRWMNAEDYATTVREAERLAKELQQWGPKVVEISEGLNSSDPRNQNRAKARLKEITNVDAIPALELILLPSSDMAAAACVEQLCRIDHRRSSIALCNAAMFLPESSSSAKQAAIEELKARPLDGFVPALLGILETPLSAEFSFYIHSDFEFLNGVIAYWHWRNVAIGGVTISNQTMSEDRNYRLRTIMRDIDEAFTVDRRSRGSIYWKAPKIDDYNLAAESLREADNRVLIEGYRNLNAAIQAKNDFINLINDRVTSLLGSLTNQSHNESPEYWWNWWNDRIEVEANSKMTRVVDEKLVGEVRHKFGHKRIAVSCFVAGTPVWTDRGPRPIDELHVGDMALSQDIETGELMYRPVIRTTTRKPKPLVTIHLGPEQITSTGGHPFFVPGEGWVRARELKAGQFLHTPTGTIKIDSVTETPDAETYNLVIDGFHTYFVGMSQALVHDVSITAPTDAVVPGLLDR